MLQCCVALKVKNHAPLALVAPMTTLYDNHSVVTLSQTDWSRSAPFTSQSEPSDSLDSPSEGV
eukprot:COSAG02_NODE_732_length_17973_cov_6.920275_16_plen_63_part_00